jgi:hypothetical protein
VILEAEQEKVAMGMEESGHQDRKMDMLRTALQQITNHNQVVENDRQKCKDMANTKAQETSKVCKRSLFPEYSLACSTFGMRRLVLLTSS